MSFEKLKFEILINIKSFLNAEYDARGASPNRLNKHDACDVSSVLNTGRYDSRLNIG